MLSYFEKNTFKWLKLKEHIFGFKGKVEGLNEAKNRLKKYYYKKRDDPKIETLFNLIKDLKNFDIYDLIKIINCPRGSLVKPLSILNRCNIIDKNLEGHRIRYKYNENVREWRLPNVSLHPILNSVKPLQGYTP